jgi:hypothetical protein
VRSGRNQKNTEQFGVFCRGKTMTLKILCLVTCSGTLLISNDLRCARQLITAVEQGVFPVRTTG